jgi:hypothetical protein
MKKIALAFTMLILVTAILFTGCDVIFKNSEDRETGSGNLETRQYNFTDFTRIDIGSTFNYEIEQSDNFNVSITADDNMFEHIKVEQDGQTLRIELKPLLHFGPATLEASISMSRLSGLESSGATRGTVIGFNSGDDLDLDVSGASEVSFEDIYTGNIEGDVSGTSKLKGELSAGDFEMVVSGASDIDGELTAKHVELNASGTSRVNLDGTCDDISVNASEASRIELGDYSVNNADIYMSGTSYCKIDVSGRMNINLSGLSELEYTGRPLFESIELSGGSHINNVGGGG